jgi:putative transposase
MLTYKARLAGIKVLIQNESHTSCCSFLDLEEIGHQVRYLGRRIHRGLFKAADGRWIHADVNGVLNIIRKAIPDAFSRGLAGTAVCPVRVNLVLGPSAKKSPV